jgi:hypothetical protein
MAAPWLAGLGGAPKPMSAGEYGKLIAEETEKWRKVLAFAGVSVDCPRILARPFRDGARSQANDRYQR